MHSFIPFAAINGGIPTLEGKMGPWQPRVLLQMKDTENCLYSGILIALFGYRHIIRKEIL